MVEKLKVLKINVEEEKSEIFESNSIGIVEYAVKEHLNRETYKYDPLSEKNIVVFGGGPLIGSNLFGVHRLVFVAKSPLTDTIYVSTLGGGSICLTQHSFNIIQVEGKFSKKNSYVIIEINKEDTVFFHEIEKEKLLEVFKDKGSLSLSNYIKENILGHRKGLSFVVGPASLHTPMGNISCWKREEIVDVAGRGGIGSVLAQAHKVVGIVIEYDKIIRKKTINIDKICNEVFGKKYIDVLMESGKKYREKGTFGGNYPKLKDKTVSYSWCFDEISKENREKIYEEKIMSSKYYGSFNIEKSENCLEPCPIACKKIVRGVKVDYEPFNSLGPLLGIFDFNLIKKIVQICDFLGFDAIEVGNCISAYLKEDSKINLDEKNKFEIVKDIMEKLAFGLMDCNVFREKVKERVPCVIYKENKFITPTQYWAIGNFIKLPLQGRYWTYYHFGDFYSPEELSEKIINRAINECLLDNFGICRFHRGIFEKVLNKIVNINLREYAMEILRKIIDYNEKSGVDYNKVIINEKTKKLIIEACKEFEISEKGKEWVRKIKKSEIEVEEYIKKIVELVITGIKNG